MGNNGQVSNCVLTLFHFQDERDFLTKYCVTAPFEPAVRMSGASCVFYLKPMFFCLFVFIENGHGQQTCC